MLLSSHLVSDLERVCDYLVVLVDSRGPGRGRGRDAARHPPPAHRARAATGTACRATSRSSRASTPTGRRTLVVRTDGPILDPAVDGHRSSASRTSCSPTWNGRPSTGTTAGAGGAAVIWLTWRQFRRPGRHRGRRRGRRGRRARRHRPPARRPRARRRRTGVRPAHQRPTSPSSGPASSSWPSSPPSSGAFWGAPLVARELEAGTHRLAWNQSVTRTRWLATKLVVTALAAALAVGALDPRRDLVVRTPRRGGRQHAAASLPGRLTPVSFAMRGRRAGGLRGLRRRPRRHPRRRAAPPAPGHGAHPRPLRRRAGRRAAVGAAAPRRRRPPRPS